jgi:16S rRNA (guanine527-N7)-methyltransferase
VDVGIRALFEQAGCALSEEDWAFFERLRQLVVRGNERMNLTRLTEPADFYLKHVLDSLLPFHVVPALRKPRARQVVADLGSGAGFPGLAVARTHPGWTVALVERTRKKAAFLEETVAALGLGNARVVPHDAREAAAHVPELDRRCHLVLARAVGRIAAVTEAAAGLVRPGGLVVHYKGAPDPAELAEGKRLAPRLKMKLLPPVVYDLPPDQKRSVVLCRMTRRGAARQRAS